MKKAETKVFEVDDIFDMTPIEPSNQANQNNTSQKTGIDDWDLFKTRSCSCEFRTYPIYAGQVIIESLKTLFCATKLPQIAG